MTTRSTTRPSREARSGRRFRSAAVLLTAAGLALPMVAAASPAATASTRGAAPADPPGVDARITTKGGELLYFELDGDWIKLALYDDRKDGYGVRGYAYADGATVTVYTGAGKGSNQTREYAVPDGPVKIKLCYTKKAKNVQCSRTVQARP